MGIFAALMWKHLILRKRRPFITCIDIFTPFLMLFSIALIHFVYEHMHYTGDVPYSDPRILYTPDTELTRMLMNHVGESQYLPRVDALPKEYDKVFLRPNESQSSEILTAMQNVDAVIVFENLQGNILPEKLNYTVHVIQPANLSTRKLFEQPSAWIARTSLLIDKMNALETMLIVANSFRHVLECVFLKKDNLGESFLRLQWAIDSSFIKLKSYAALDLQNITIKPFRRSYTGQKKWAFYGHYYVTMYAVLLSVPIAPLLSFLFLVIRVNEEKSSGIQRLTEMAGVSPSMLVITEILNSLPACLLYSIGGTLVYQILCQKIECTTRTEPFIIFSALFLHFTSVIAMAFPCSYIFKTDVHTLSLSMFIYIATWIFCNIVIRNNLFVVFLNGFIPYMPMYWIAGELITTQFDPDVFGTNFNNWSENYMSRRFLSSGSVRTSLAMQLIQIFLFLILSWVLKKLRPGKYGVELPWNFLFQKEYWMKRAYITKGNIRIKGSYDPSYEKYFVDSPDDLEVAVSVINVQKIFKIARTNIIALDKVSLNFYKNEITVLIGHNGAGKTTLLSIIAGMLKQSSGNVYVESFDTVLQQANLRKRIGMCPQHNLFINDFTVQEHLIFFTMISGKNLNEAKTSSQELMSQLNLSKKASWTTSKLSEATLRRLQIGCVLCGNPSVLLLDDPTSGLDVESRREIWDMLLTLRGRRTMIITTQLLEEADILGDRIIALHAGKLRCNASPSQLKNAFGSGYRVPITTVHRPDVSKITATIRKVAPAAILKNKTLRTLVYYIPPDANMVELFNNLEYNRTSLDIESMGFSGTSLEEVFMELCADVQIDTYNDHDEVSSNKDALNTTGWHLISTHTYELLKRQFDYTVSKLGAFLSLQVLIPCALLIVIPTAKYGTINWFYDVDRTPKRLDLASRATYSYKTNAADNRVSRDKLKSLYPSLLIQDLSENHGKNCSCEKCRENDESPLNKNAIHIYLDDQQALLRYDPQVKHSALVGLNLLSNIIVSQRSPQIRDKTINMKIDPYEIYADTDLQFPYTTTETAMLYVFIITTAVINAVALPCKERLTSTRHIHEMAGCPPALYWLVTLAYHMACYLLFICSAAISMFYFYIKTTRSHRRLMGAYFVVLLLCGLNFFLFAYVLSFFFNKRTTAIIILIMAYFSGLFFPSLMIAADMFYVIPHRGLSTFNRSIDNIGVFIPAYMFFRSFMRMLESFQLNLHCRYIMNMCDTQSPTIPYVRPRFDYCCDTSAEYGLWYRPYDMAPYAVGSSLLIVAFQIIVNAILVILLEYRMLNRLHYEIDKRRSVTMPTKKYESSDVTDEKNYVRNTIKKSRESIKEKILVSRVWKIYFSLFRKPTFALKDLNYSVKKGECFGLIGLSGSGKTTHFKVITCQGHSTKGKMFVNGQYVKCNAMRYANSLGYCPQSYGLDNFRSGESNMNMLLRLRGLSNHEAQNATKAWLNTIGLKSHAKKAVWRYSMGMRRRLAIGCALFSGTPVKLLDEPTAAVDVAAKHLVWAVIKRGISHGDAVVLSSNNMEEVERLCSRLTILDSGEMAVLGSLKNFKNLYAPGRTVYFKFRVSVLKSAGALRVQSLKDSMYREFSCFVSNEHLTTLWFTITAKLALNVIFVRLKLLTTNFKDIVEDYSAHDGNMEDAFMHFLDESRSTIQPKETW